MANHALLARYAGYLEAKAKKEWCQKSTVEKIEEFGTNLLKIQSHSMEWLFAFNRSKKSIK